jgi:opacity protein-like surface antigen
MFHSLRRVAAVLVLCASGSLAAAAECCTISPCESLTPSNCCSNPCALDAGCTAEPACCQECCCCDPIWYIALNLRGTLDTVKTRGFDTPPPNEGEEEEEIDPLGLGGALGWYIPAGDNRVRVEAEGMYLSAFHVDTNNVLPQFPPAYYSAYTGRWAVLGNVWYDIPLNERFEFYFGGGVGYGGAEMEANSILSAGTAKVSDTIWQVGCGGVRHYGNFSVDLGYRFMDFGTYEVPLYNGGGQSGFFRTDITSHQIFLSFRYNSFAKLFAR